MHLSGPECSCTFCAVQNCGVHNVRFMFYDTRRRLNDRYFKNVRFRESSCIDLGSVTVVLHLFSSGFVLIIVREYLFLSWHQEQRSIKVIDAVIYSLRMHSAGVPKSSACFSITLNQKCFTLQDVQRVHYFFVFHHVDVNPECNQNTVNRKRLLIPAIQIRPWSP